MQSDNPEDPVILVGHDGREHGADGLALAGRLARALDARVVVANVIHKDRPRVAGSDELEAALRAESEAMLAELPLAGLGVPAAVEAVAAESAEAGLSELAEQLGALMIVVASSHRGRIGRVLAGTTAERLLRDAPCAVAVAPRSPIPSVPTRR